MAKWRWVAAGASLMMASSVQAMPAETFLAKVDALMAKGPLALFSSDVGLLKREGQRAGTELRAERLALLAQHQSPAYCPPAKAGMSSDELIARLRRIPKRDLARMDFKAAMKQVLIDKYPCR